MELTKNCQVIPKSIDIGVLLPNLKHSDKTQKTKLRGEWMTGTISLLQLSCNGSFRNWIRQKGNQSS